MDNVYREAFAEVLEILKNSNQKIIEKIPEKFITFLTENKDNNYVVQIDFTDENWDNSIKQETQEIIALIYRDYLCSIEERVCLIKQDKEILEKIEKEKREKYNYDNLFKNKETPRIKEEVVAMVEYKQSNFILKILNKIKSFFNKIL